jgi:hypothetical protein
VSLREAEAAEANAVLALVCRAVLFQMAHAPEVITVEDPEAFVASWVQIFTALQCPSSRVFENYHSKSQIAEQPAAPVRRRVLVPLNPAVDPIYLDHSAVKYGKEPPQPMLLMSDIVDFETMPSISTQNTLFKG